MDKWIGPDWRHLPQAMDAQTGSIRNCIGLDDAFVELLAQSVSTTEANKYDKDK